MKTTIYITKELVFFLLLLSLNLFFLWKGMVAYDRSENRIRIDKLTAADCKEGNYVVGTIDRYARTLSYDEFGGVHFSGVSTEIIADKDYKVYTIPAGEGQYIRIMVGDIWRKKALGAFHDGQGESVSFEGKLLETSMSTHYKDWCDSVPEENFADKVISQYVIKEISIEKEKKILDAGFTFLIATFLQLLTLQGVVVTREIVKKPGRIPVKLYQLKDMAVTEQKRLEILEKRLATMKRDSYWAVGALIVSLMMVIVNPYVEVLLVWFLVIFIAAREILQYMMNSNLHGAGKLMKLFDKEPLLWQIRECKENLEEIRIRIEDAEYW